MKKLFAFGLFLALLLGVGVPASAMTVTVEWDIPGSVKIQTEGMSGPYADLSPTQTSFVYTTSTDYASVYVYANDGYSLVSAATTDGSRTFTPAVNYMNQQKYVGGYLPWSLDGCTIKVECEKIERNDQFSINVENGLDYLSASFKSGYTLDLKEGLNSYNFSPSIDNPLTISLNGLSEAYSVTLNGTPVTKNPYYARYEVTVTTGSTLDIRVFESDADIPKDVTLTLKYGPGMEGCLYNIRDWTLNKFIEPADIVDNTVTIRGKSDIQLNLVDKDYTYSKFILNGQDITSEYNDYQKKLRFILPNENSVIEIEGTATVYNDIYFTGYIVNGEGLDLRLTYSGSTFDLPEGEAVDTDITAGGITLPKALTKKYTIPVSEKTGQFFFGPKTGYYIKDVYTAIGSTVEQHSGSASINSKIDGTTFYMIVEKLPESYSCNVTTTGSTNIVRIKASSPIGDNWDNPATISRVVSPGEAEVSFIPGYDTPFAISSMGQEGATAAVYLDGAAVTGTLDSNSGATVFTVNPYAPTEGSIVAAGVKSEIRIYNSANERPTMSGASLVLEDGAKADFFYSPVMHVANPAGQQVISGTQMTVKPLTPGAVVKYKDVPVELNEAGEYVFNVTGNARTNIITVAMPPKYVDIDVNPADGSTVKQISRLKITVPSIDPDFVNMMEGDVDVLSLIEVKKGNDVVANVAELEEPTGDDYGNIVYSLVLSPAVTEAGTYTITVPQGAFVEKTWSDTDEAMVVVAGGYISSAYTGTVTVDPNFKSILDNYELDPEDGATVDEITAVNISFPQVYDYFSNWEFTNATFTNGSETYEGMITYDWGSEAEYRVMKVYPSQDDEFITINTPGTWELTIEAGTFTLNGEANSEIKATYTVKTPAPAYALTPEPGSVIEAFDNIVLTFPEATSAEFVGDTWSMTLTNGYSYAAPGINCVKDETAEVPTFMLSLIDGAQQPPVGTYNLIIEEGVFKVDGVDNGEIIAQYTIEHAVSTDYLITPESGIIVCHDYGYDFAYIFDEAATLSGLDASKVSLEFNDTAIPATSYEAMTEYNMLMFMVFDSEYCKEGTLKVSIAEGAFNIGSTPSPAIETTWTVMAEKTYEAVVTPAPTEGDQKVADLSTIYILFPEAKTGEVYQNSGAQLRNSTYSYSQAGAINLEEQGDQGVKFAVSFNPAPTTLGTYTFFVNEGTFVLDGVQSSPMIDITYAFDPSSGVSSIFADADGLVTVYTLDGTLVLNSEPADKLAELAKGLYIVNGVKVLLK